MFIYFGLLFRRIKSRLSFYKPGTILKNIRIKKSLKNELKIIKKDLKELGYSHITNNRMKAWKYYSNGGYRITFTAIFETKKVFIKIGSISEKIENSIYALEHYSDIFDFAPKGERICYKNRSCYKTDFVDNYTFYEMSGYIKKHISDYVEQAVAILNKLDEFKIVHCDVETYNLIFRKHDKRMILIDFDTANSSMVNLHCPHAPKILVMNNSNGKPIFDDAYSFYYIFKRFLGNKCDEKVLEPIKMLIGRNTFEP